MNKLNEKNLQACFQYNGTTGEDVFENITGNIIIDVDSPRVRQQVNSDKICIDLGYSVDGDPRKDWKFALDSNVLIIQTVAFRSDLSSITLATNECAVVTNDPNFRTCLWLNYESNGKTLTYHFLSQNTSISSWMFDEVATKLNAYDPTALDVRITDAENRITGAEGRLDTAETNITELQGKVSTNENKIKDLEDKTAGFARSADLNNTTFTDNVIIASNRDLSVTGKSSITGGLGVAGLSSLQDIHVAGNVRGVLKDANGFKYEKVKRGKIQDYYTFDNIRIKLYPTGDCEIDMSYIEIATNDIGSGDISNTITQPLPFVLDNLYNIIFIDNGQLLFTISAINNNNPNVSNIQIKYRNITNNTQSLSSYKSNIIIYAKVTETKIQNVTWD